MDFRKNDLENNNNITRVLILFSYKWGKKIKKSYLIYNNISFLPVAVNEMFIGTTHLGNILKVVL